MYICDRACKHPLGAGFNDPEHICLEIGQNAQDEGGRVDVVREEGERSAHAVEKNMDGGAKLNGLGDSKANEPGGNVREGGCRLSAVAGRISYGEENFLMALISGEEGGAGERGHAIVNRHLRSTGEGAGRNGVGVGVVVEGDEQGSCLQDNLFQDSHQSDRGSSST